MIDVEKLNALVDDELDPQERADVEAQLAAHPESAAQIGSIRLLKSAVKDHIVAVPCEDEWKACVKRLNEIDGTRKTKAFVDRWAWAMCSVLFAFIIMVGMVNRSHPGLRAGTGDLTRAGMGIPLRDAYRWVKQQFGTAPSVPAERLQTVEAWQGTFDGHPLARIHLRDAEGDLGLVVVPGSVVVEGVAPMDDGRHYSGQIGDKNCVAWSQNGIVMILFAQRDAAELREISNTIHVNP